MGWAVGERDGRRSGGEKVVKENVNPNGGQLTGMGVEIEEAFKNCLVVDKKDGIRYLMGDCPLNGFFKCRNLSIKG